MYPRRLPTQPLRVDTGPTRSRAQTSRRVSRLPGSGAASLHRRESPGRAAYQPCGAVRWGGAELDGSAREQLLRQYASDLGTPCFDPIATGAGNVVSALT